MCSRSTNILPITNDDWTMDIIREIDLKSNEEANNHRRKNPDIKTLTDS
jgi:hypothetical protein